MMVIKQAVKSAYEWPYFDARERLRWFDSIVDIVARPRNQREFVAQPQRWKIERTFGWLDWSRILSKEYERTTESSESDIYLASIRLMLRRLAHAPK